VVEAEVYCIEAEKQILVSKMMATIAVVTPKSENVDKVA